MKKKNKNIERLIKRKHTLIEEISKRHHILSEIDKKITAWSWKCTGDIMHQWMHRLSNQLSNGERPVSLKKCSDACTFDPIDRDYIREVAQKSAEHYRYQIDREYIWSQANRAAADPKHQSEMDEKFRIL